MTSTHPRRRVLKLTTPPLTPPASPSPLASLQKSETFSARSPSSDLYDPIDNARFIPKRSPTTLADLVLDDAESQNYREQSLKRFLNDIDEVVAGRASPDALAEIEVWQTVSDDQVPVSEPMVIDEKKDEGSDRNHHYSDSGLGSSIDSPIEPHSSISSRSNAVSSASTFSAINQSHSYETVHRRPGRRLSPSAFNHIDRYFLQPILKDSSLKDFHPLIEAIPRQVGDNFISNLRDLEKTLLYQAPKFCLSSKSFRDFWTFSISCLHSTVQYLSDRDQRRPSDRPYTSSYFVDLVEQIRRYAEIMARTREREANGEELDDMDYSPDETVRLEGGLSASGRPAGLVRMKNGKSISLAPENANFETMSNKRPLDDDDDDEFDSADDDVLRSMARRRKSDKAADIVHTCRACSKEFKRPCDLTKHEKTHSRPFKCSDSTCRYHELGWPTEKERDRHENDKHSSNPTLYKCQFQPCSYSSKRESNCKQHMEKAHGWTYVRSKSNGRSKQPASIFGSAPSPFSPAITTPSSSHQQYGSPESLLTPSPVMGNSLSPPELFNSYDAGRRNSATTSDTAYSNNHSPFNGFVSALDMGPPTKFSHIGTSPMVAGLDFDFGAPMTSNPYETPALSTLDNFDFDSTEFLQTAASSSALAVPATLTMDPTLPTTSGAEMFDETFGEMTNEMLQSDFVLFDDAVSGNGAELDSSNWFPDVTGGGLGQFDGLNMAYDPSNSTFYQ